MRVTSRPIVRSPRSALAMAAAAVALLAFAPAAAAQTFTVTDLEDTGAVGDGSLRGELKAANQQEGADTIDFAPGLAGTITLSGTGLTITGPVDIEGPGPSTLTVRQISGGHRVFLVKLAEAGAVTFTGLHLTGGNTPERGGDIGYSDSEGAQQATLTVAECLIDGGSAQDEGGGIAAYDAPLTLRDSVVTENDAGGGGGVLVGGKGYAWTIEGSTISGNEATNSGGGILAEDGQGEILDSTIAENRSGEDGGGAYLATGAHDAIAVVNSTVAGNGADEDGGGIIAFAESSERGVTIEDATIAGNHGGGGAAEAGGLQVFSGVPRPLVDTIVADNTGGAPDVSGPVAAAFSLLGDPTGASVTEAIPGSDLLGVDPLLRPLAENGGPTETMALPANSPAVNKGGGALAVDQRGDPRPVAFPGVPFSTASGANGADIGAYELQGAPGPSPSSPSNPIAPPPVAAAPAGPPRVRLSCPKSAGHAGCRFTLVVVSGKPRRVKGKLIKPSLESRPATLKLAGGKSGLLALRPKPKFAARLASATKLWVREVETTKGTTHTSYRQLRVVS